MYEDQDATETYNGRSKNFGNSTFPNMPVPTPARPGIKRGLRKKLMPTKEIIEEYYDDDEYYDDYMYTSTTKRPLMVHPASVAGPRTRVSASRRRGMFNQARLNRRRGPASYRSKKGEAKEDDYYDDYYQDSDYTTQRRQDVDRGTS
jgi:hypothetical protein